MKKPVIVSMGEVLWDLFPEGPQFGGAAANFACHAAALGGRVSLVSAVGNDPRGRDARDLLHRYQVDTRFLQTAPEHPTGSVSVSLDANGKPTFTIHPDAAWDRTGWPPELEDFITRADAVYFGTLGQRGDESRTTIRRALKVAEKAGVPRVLDINLRPPFFDHDLIRESIAHASLLKVSDDELPKVAEACGMDPADDPESTLRQLQKRYTLDLVVMTRGAYGALLIAPEEAIDQPGIPVEVLDTVGAGDAFIATLIIGLLEGSPLKETARKACERASLVCTQPGAVPSPDDAP